MQTVPKTRALSKSRRKYVPASGREFEVTVAAIDAYKTGRTRDAIAYILLAATGTAMLLAMGYGFYTGNFGGLKDVWTVAGPVTGGVIGHYSHRGRRDSG
jgi:hypothetical protein